MTHTLNKIMVRRGTEGPRHDPYSFTEVMVNGRNGIVTYHEGLGEWTKIDRTGGKYDGSLAKKAFEIFTGVSPHSAIRATEMAPYRRHASKCGSRDFESHSGFPGETFIVCVKCGEVVDSHFNEEAVR